MLDGLARHAGVCTPARCESVRRGQVIHGVDADAVAKGQAMWFERRHLAIHHRQAVELGEQSVSGRGRQVAIHHQLDDCRAGRQHIVEVGEAVVVPPLQRVDHRVAILTGTERIRFEQAVDRDCVAPVPTVESPIRRAIGDARQCGE